MKKAMGWLSLYAVSIFAVVAGAWPAPASAAPGGEPMWAANAGSTITGEHTATLTGGNTSVETTAAFKGFDVGAGEVLSLSYALEGGATCIGGAPRVFATVGGVTVNSWDQHIGDGVDAACAGDVTLPAGKLTAIGVVWDNGQKDGAVKVTGLSLGERSFDFKATTPLTVVTPVKPDYTAPTCEARGKVEPKTTEGIRYDRTEANGVVNVKAKAKAGYVLAQGAAKEWAFPVAKLTGAQCEPTTTPTNPGGGGNPTTQPTKPTPTATPTSGTPTGTSSPTSTLSPAAGAIGGGDSGSLPTTGPKVLKWLGIGGLLIAVGGVLLGVAKRRRENEDDTQVMPAI